MKQDLTKLKRKDVIRTLRVMHRRDHSERNKAEEAKEKANIERRNKAKNAQDEVEAVKALLTLTAVEDVDAALALPALAPE